MARFLRSADATAAAVRRPRPFGSHQGKRLVLLPPEGVPLSLEIACTSTRIGAQLVDLIITIVAGIALFMAIATLNSMHVERVGAVAALLSLLLGTPYYILSELMMNGRTLGKKALGIRVVSRDGKGLSTHQVVVRNLTKEVEFFVPVSFLSASSEAPDWLALAVLIWTVIVIVIPIRSKANQRLGDIVAGTAVVVQPRPALLADIATQVEATAKERFVFTSTQLDLYGAYELQVLEQLLRRQGKAAHQSDMAEVGSRIRAKIVYPEPVAPEEEAAFLQSFYVAQRSYLEQKKLLGDSREDKFHSMEPRASDP
ncbi:RDD family protein [Consotaella aegiceratis]|uniref:RDD family protein n=1 Tax=Consotaella aegiceratis TaxID=3097961 RepID=UPI002F3FDB0B